MYFCQRVVRRPFNIQGHGKSLFIMSSNDSWKTYSVCFFSSSFSFSASSSSSFFKRFFVTEFLETVANSNTKCFAQAGTFFSRHPLPFWWVR